MLYRRFGEVQARLLLEAQDDLRRLQKELHFLDLEETEGEDKEHLKSRKVYNEGSSVKRQELMKELKKAFKDYGIHFAYETNR